MASDVAKVQTLPFDFTDERKLGSALEGCDVLYCTYWIRFAREGDTHLAAADRCAKLFDLARRVGVQRIVFTSHTHAREDSPYAYIAGKAQAAAALRSCGVPSYAIARPCGIFGDTAEESILMNNAAWVLRRVPLFLLAGTGQHRFQPIHVRDMAQLLYDLGRLTETDAGAGDGLGSRSRPNEERDACGPDAPTSLELFKHLGRAVGARGAVLAPGFLPTRLITKLTKPIDWWTGDVLLDGDDLDLLGSGLTVAEDPDDLAIRSRRSLLSWIEQVAPTLGNEYVSSVRRYYYAR